VGRFRVAIGSASQFLDAQQVEKTLVVLLGCRLHGSLRLLGRSLSRCADRNWPGSSWRLRSQLTGAKDEKQDSRHLYESATRQPL